MNAFRLIIIFLASMFLSLDIAAGRWGWVAVNTFIIIYQSWQYFSEKKK